MKLDDGSLRDLLEDPELAPPRESRGCPDAAAARAILAGFASEEERLAFVDHMVECSDCATEQRTSGEVARWSSEAAVQLGAEAAAVEKAEEANERVPSRSPSARAGVWIAAAAAVVAAAGIALVLARRPASGPGTSFERGTASVVMPAVSPAEGARLVSPPSRLEWEALPGATSYEVTIYDAESSPIWKSERVTAAGVDLPAGVAAKLPAGHSYLWRVVARVGLDARPSSVHGFSVSP
jgi:hypothetical protein